MFDLKHAIADIRAKAMRVAADQGERIGTSSGDVNPIRLRPSDLLRRALEEQLKFENPGALIGAAPEHAVYVPVRSTKVVAGGGTGHGQFTCDMHGGQVKAQMAYLRESRYRAYVFCHECAQRWDDEHALKPIGETAAVQEALAIARHIEAKAAAVATAADAARLSHSEFIEALTGSSGSATSLPADTEDGA